MNEHLYGRRWRPNSGVSEVYASWDEQDAAANDAEAEADELTWETYDPAEDVALERSGAGLDEEDISAERRKREGPAEVWNGWRAEFERDLADDAAADNDQEEVSPPATEQPPSSARGDDPEEEKARHHATARPLTSHRDASPPNGRATADRAYQRLPMPQSLPAGRPWQGRPPAEFVPNDDFATGGPEEEKVDIRKYLWLLFKHRWLILSAIVCCGSIGVVTTFLTTPIYRAAATIQISRDAPKNVTGVAAADQITQVDGSQSYEFYQTQYQLLRSRALAERVVSALNLQDDATFMAANVSSQIANLKRLAFGAAPASQTSGSSDLNARTASAVGRVLGGLGVQPVNDFGDRQHHIRQPQSGCRSEGRQRNRRCVHRRKP